MVSVSRLVRNSYTLRGNYVFKSYVHESAVYFEACDFFIHKI